MRENLRDCEVAAGRFPNDPYEEWRAAYHGIDDRRIIMAEMPIS